MLNQVRLEMMQSTTIQIVVIYLHVQRPHWNLPRPNLRASSFQSCGKIATGLGLSTILGHVDRTSEICSKMGKVA